MGGGGGGVVSKVCYILGLVVVGRGFPNLSIVAISHISRPNVSIRDLMINQSKYKRSSVKGLACLYSTLKPNRMLRLLFIYLLALSPLFRHS